ncbi:hypothetical protein SDC9_78467 [bioreactor metagenome]|uniref:Uncharacterized protein n=1 Tax=bioreactor metagenome TaxID=1076179 RepID=A0A644YTK3_9ZZZZ
MLELVHALLLEDQTDVSHVDPGGGEGVEGPVGLGVVAGDGVGGGLAVVGVGHHRLLRHGVDHAVDDQLGDVHRVRVRRVLHAGRGPQRALRVGPPGRQRLPAVGGDGPLEQLVGEPGVGQAGPALERGGLVGAEGVEALVDLGVHAGHEERGDRVDRRQVLACGGGLLEPGHVGVHHLLVAGDREDQRHVDADALGDRRGDRRQPGGGRRDLDQHVLAIDEGVQLLRLGDGRIGPVRQAGIDLEGDAAVEALGGGVQVGEEVAGGADVVGGGDPDHTLDVLAGGLELGDLVGIVLTSGHRAGEDRRVAGDAADRVLVDQVLQVAGGEPGPGEVVQPDGHPGVGQGLQSFVHGGSFACFRAGQAPRRAGPQAARRLVRVGPAATAARDSWAAATTASGVRPNFSNSSPPAAEAP